MKVLIFATLLLNCALCRAQYSYVTVDSRIYSVNDYSVWTTFNDCFEVVGFAGDTDNDLICRAFDYQLVSFDSSYWIFNHYHGESSSRSTKKYTGLVIILRHYPGARQMTIGSEIGNGVRAIRVGQTEVTSGPSSQTTSVGSSGYHVSSTYDDLSPSAVYDLGIPYYPPLTAEQIAAQKKKLEELDDRAVRWEETQATNGEPDEQYVLGMRYLKGDHIPKDLDTAKMWLEKSAAQGDIDASNALVNFATLAVTNQPTLSAKANP